MKSYAAEWRPSELGIHHGPRDAMSYYGRKAVAFDLEERWARAHKHPGVHRHEATRILAGDYSPIVRELRPGLEAGQVCVLAKTREQRQAITDPHDPLKLTGEVAVAPPRPLFEIVIREPVRHRSGVWRVPFDVLDRRDPSRLVRRKPPSKREGEYVEPTPEEIEQAREESAYTTNSIEAVDHLDSVPVEYQNVLAMQAKERRGDFLRQARADELMEQDLRRLKAEITELAKRSAKMGLDPVDVLAPIMRAVQQQHRGLRSAA